MTMSASSKRWATTRTSEFRKVKMPSNISLNISFRPRAQAGSQNAATLGLPVVPPFDLEATVRLLQRRPNNRIDIWSAGRYRRVLVPDNELLLCTVVNQGTIDSPELELQVEPPPTPRAFEKVRQTVRKMLGLDLPPGFELPR